MNRTASWMVLLACAGLVTLTPAGVGGDQPDRAALEKKLVETLSGATLVGYYTKTTIDPSKLREERYKIYSMERLADTEDTWTITAQVTYGERDLRVPVPIQVKWAGDTPVLTLTETAIPLLGTFTTRVMIYEDHYAGYWRHDDVGGQLFGRIEREKDAED